MVRALDRYIRDVPAPEQDVQIKVQYDLPVTTTEEPTDGVAYCLTWRGDEVVGIRPNTDFLPFYSMEQV